MSEAKIVFDKLADLHAVLPGGSKGQMFGMPVAKVYGKAFMGFFQENIILKLDKDSLNEALALPGSCLFDPMGNGRAMKEWAQIPFEHSAKWGGFAQKARLYLLELTKK